MKQIPPFKIDVSWKKQRIYFIIFGPFTLVQHSLYDVKYYRVVSFQITLIGTILDEYMYKVHETISKTNIMMDDVFRANINWWNIWDIITFMWMIAHFKHLCKQ